MYTPQAPVHGAKSSDNVRINDVRMVESQNANGIYWRLQWTYLHDLEDRSIRSGLPYSGITGPFSHFLIRVNGLSVGRAYALEYILPDFLMRDRDNDGMSIEVLGIGFDGTKLAQSWLKISKDADGSQMDLCK